MRELNASRFFDTIQDVHRIRTVIDTKFDDEGRMQFIESDDRINLINAFHELAAATNFVGAEVASMAARRMGSILGEPGRQISLIEISDCIKDVENRLRDEFNLFSIIVLDRNQKALFDPANVLAGGGI